MNAIRPGLVIRTGTALVAVLLVTGPGLDHVDLSYTIPADGTSWKTCIHDNAGPGTYKINYGEGVRFKKVVWRGECP